MRGKVEAAGKFLLDELLDPLGAILAKLDLPTHDRKRCRPLKSGMGSDPRSPQGATMNAYSTQPMTLSNAAAANVQ